jgi:hypothetical protein
MREDDRLAHDDLFEIVEEQPDAEMTDWVSIYIIEKETQSLRRQADAGGNK